MKLWDINLYRDMSHVQQVIAVFSLYACFFIALSFECFYRLLCKNPLFSPWKKYVTYISLFSVAFNIP